MSSSSSVVLLTVEMRLGNRASMSSSLMSDGMPEGVMMGEPGV